MVRQAAAPHPVVEVVVGEGGGGGNLLEAEPPEQAGAVLLNVKLQLQASDRPSVSQCKQESKQQRKKARNEASKTKERQSNRRTQNVKAQSVSETDTVCGWMQPEEAVDMQLAEPDRCLLGLNHQQSTACCNKGRGEGGVLVRGERQAYLLSCLRVLRVVVLSQPRKRKHTSSQSS